MKVSTTLLNAMLVTAVIGLSTACTTQKGSAKHPHSKIEDHHVPSSNPDGCPACGRG